MELEVAMPLPSLCRHPIRAVSGSPKCLPTTMSSTCKTSRPKPWSVFFQHGAPKPHCVLKGARHAEAAPRAARWARAMPLSSSATVCPVLVETFRTRVLSSLSCSPNQLTARDGEGLGLLLVANAAITLTRLNFEGPPGTLADVDGVSSKIPEISMSMFRTKLP